MRLFIAKFFMYISNASNHRDEKKNSENTEYS